MDTISLWEDITQATQKFPQLTADLEVDVAIIGGGITGITAALELIKAGKKVALIEARRIASGTTGNSTGNLYVAVQPYFQKILSKFNEETVKIIAHSRKTAIDYIENQINKNQIKCHFTRRPWYAYTNSEDELAFLEKEIDLLKRIGIEVDYTKDFPFPLKFKKAAIMPAQARFNPRQYVVSLAEILSKLGCLIYENTRVTSIEENDNCVLQTQNGKIIAKEVIIATHTPIGINTIQMFTAPYRSYVVGVELSDGKYPEGHFWNIEHPHYATCTHSVHESSPELLLIAGSHHKTGQSPATDLHYKELEDYLSQHYPVKKIRYRWSAQHYQAADDVPYIGLAGHTLNHTYHATGFFADGLLYGTIAGILLSDLIIKKKNTWESIYNSNRVTITSSAEFFIKENLNVFLQYMKDIPNFSNESYESIKAGEAKVVAVHNEKYGVYRDNEQKLHIVSAVCTHMQAIVNWNTAEKTWDCPCHGSRFSYDGKVIEGPARLDLEIKTKET